MGKLEAMRRSETARSPQELRSLCATVVRAGRVLQETLSARLEGEMDISLDEFEVLSGLDAAAEGRLRMKDIGARLLVSKAGVTRLVDRLEEQGFAERAPCPSDRRVIWARITPAGRAVLARAAPLADAVMAELVGARLAPDEVTRTQAALAPLSEGAWKR